MEGIDIYDGEKNVIDAGNYMKNIILNMMRKKLIRLKHITIQSIRDIINMVLTIFVQNVVKSLWNGYLA